MIISFDTEKFKETNLGLYDYMILVMYEKKDCYTARELSDHLGITVRTCYAKRKILVDLGWLLEYGMYYYLSDKTKMLIAA